MASNSAFRGSNSSNDDDHHAAQSSSDGNATIFRRSLSSALSFSNSLSNSSSSSLTGARSTSHGSMLKSSTLRKSLQRLDSRLSITCDGSDLGQLYLSSPEQDASQILSGNHDLNNQHGLRRSESWIQATDLYGKRTSFRRLGSYANFLGNDMMSDINEDDNEEERILLIEETYEDGSSTRLTKLSPMQSCRRRIKSPAVIVPAMMIVDLILGVSLSLYDSNLLRNVPGFRFPLVYAFTQKLTNAIASLVLICLSRRWERKDGKKHAARMNISTSIGKEDKLSTTLPSVREFKRHVIPLTAVALVQTISAAFANQALLAVPLPLFKVCLMCGPIFVALMSKITDGQLYSGGRIVALALIGAGASRAVYAEMEGADNPRRVATGAGYALGASAFSGVGLVLSSVLMHHRGDDGEDGDDNWEEETRNEKDEVELNPLSLLFYLSCEQVLMLSAYLCPWASLLSQQPTSGGEIMIEEMNEFAAFSIYLSKQPMVATSYLMIGSMLSLALAVLTFVLVNRTSPVATSLLGNVRSIATVAISTILAGKGGRAMSGGAAGLFGSAALGYTCTLAGGVAYAFAALGKGASSPSKS